MCSCPTTRSSPGEGMRGSAIVFVVPVSCVATVAGGDRCGAGAGGGARMRQTRSQLDVGGDFFLNRCPPPPFPHQMTRVCFCFT